MQGSNPDGLERPSIHNVVSSNYVVTMNDIK